MPWREQGGVEHTVEGRFHGCGMAGIQGLGVKQRRLAGPWRMQQLRMAATVESLRIIIDDLRESSCGMIFLYKPATAPLVFEDPHAVLVTTMLDNMLSIQ